MHRGSSSSICQQPSVACSIYEKIGKGKHSTVYKGRKKKTIQYHAIKSVDKSQKPRVLQEVGEGCRLGWQNSPEARAAKQRTGWSQCPACCCSVLIEGRVEPQQLHAGCLYVHH